MNSIETFIENNVLIIIIGSIFLSPFIFGFIGNRVVPRYFSISKIQRILLAAAGTSFLPIIILLWGGIEIIIDEIRNNPFKEFFISIGKSFSIFAASWYEIIGIILVCLLLIWIFISTYSRIEMSLDYSETSFWDQIVFGLALILGFFGVFIYIIITEGLIKEGGLFDPDE